jgi:hypothetical protein
MRSHHVDHVPGARRLDPGFIRESMPEWKKKYPGVEGLNVAVMGCIVNGPGESKHADIGISLPGTGEAPAAPVFIDGKKAVTLRGPTVAQDFKKLVIDYIERRYGRRRRGADRRGVTASFCNPPGLRRYFINLQRQRFEREVVARVEQDRAVRDRHDLRHQRCHHHVIARLALGVRISHLPSAS